MKKVIKVKSLFYTFANNKFQKYLFVGGLSYLIVTIITATLHDIFGVMESNSFAIALVVVFIINFFALRTYVFKSKSVASFAVIKFFITSLSFRGLEYILFVIITNLGVHYIIGLTISMLVSVVSKYFVYKKIVYN